MPFSLLPRSIRGSSTAGTTLAPGRRMLRALKDVPGPRLRRCLLVIERGAGAVRATAHESFDETTAVVQLMDEDRAAFAERVLRRLAGLVHTGRCPEAVAVMLGSDAADASAARRAVLNEVLNQPGVKELSLQAPLLTSPTLELLELVEGVLAADTRVLVRLRLGRALEPSEAESGVFWSVPPAKG